MAPQQVNNLMHWVQVIMLFIVTGLLGWIGFEVRSFGEYKARTEQIDKQQDAQISSSLIRLGEQEKKTNDHDKKIYYLEAILQQEPKKNNRPSPVNGAGF